MDDIKLIKDAGMLYITVLKGNVETALRKIPTKDIRDASVVLIGTPKDRPFIIKNRYGQADRVFTTIDVIVRQY